MSKSRVRFVILDGKVIYPRMLHSQEVSCVPGAFAETVAPMGNLRNPESLRVAALVI